MAENTFGFSIEAGGGADYTPIVKYDARAGRIFRVDRVDNGNGFANEQIDITANFKAVMDFENVEVGWAKFTPSSAPSFALVPMGQQLPAKPSPDHKNVIRMLLKLNKTCSGDRPVREFALQAKSSLSGIEKVYLEYKRERANYPGQLPVVSLQTTTPTTSGSGAQKSTNYAPVFKIEGWKKRPEDLIHIPAASNGSGTTQSSPQTGSSTVPPPNKMAPPPQQPAADDDDFG